MAAPNRRNIIAGLAGLTAFGLGTSGAWANQPAKKSIAKPTPPPKPKLVFLDPGHGGRDPGALGVRGTQEKVVVMAIACGLLAPGSTWAAGPATIPGSTLGRCAGHV